ncbi:MAG: hypothetical protein ACTSWX_08380, partial [Promethearchaeota archaeon]
MPTREKINDLIIQADNDIQTNNISSGLQKLEIARQMAKEIGWDERVKTISSLIEDVNQKLKEQDEHKKKLKILEEKHREMEEKEKQREAALLRLQDKQKAEKQRRMEELRKKKELEDKLSNEAYNYLEIGSQALLKNEYQKGMEAFVKALEHFKTIKWTAEISRTQELLNDAKIKYENYKHKLKEEEKQAEKIWEAQKKTQEQIELAKKLQEEKKKKQISIEMETKKTELLKKKQSEKALSLLDEAIHNRNLNQFELAIKNYQDALTIFINIGWKKEAEEVREEINLTIKQKEKLELENKKLQEKIVKQKQEEEEIEKKAREAQHLKDLQERKEREKKQKKLEEFAEKESILKSVLKEISEIEDKVNKYENQVGLGNILSLNSPYDNAVKIYGEGSKKLKEIGYIEQANRLSDGENAYKQKIKEDRKLRELEKKKIEKIKKEKEELERKAREAQRIREEELRKEKEKRQKELEDIIKKESQLKDVLGDISKIEDVINEYEAQVGLGKILSLECPYSKAVELYDIGQVKLKEAGLNEQAIRLEEGKKSYERKLIEDQKQREKERERIEKAKQEEEELERKAREAQKIREEELRKEKEKRQKELELVNEKETKLKEILTEISNMEEIVNQYEKSGNYEHAECPYSKAIILYSTGSKKLEEIGFHEQAKLLKDGEISYKKKLENYNKIIEEKKKRLEKAKQEEEELERKAQEARRLKELQEKKLREKRQKELEELSKKESQLKDVLGDISKIEDVVSDYAKQVSLGKILSLDCPYPKAAELYKIGTQKLRDAGLIEQAERLDEGRRTYEQKIIEDKKLRELEIKRIERAKQEEEELERKAQEARRLKELQEKELREKR